jgi:CspA family cold shock protein
MPKGVIKWFNEKKGYGFISNEEGGDVFVHYTGIQGEGFRTLNEGDKVEFEIETSDKGPRAVSVKPI